MSAPGDSISADAAGPESSSATLAYSVYVRLHTPARPKFVGAVADAIAQRGSLITALDVSDTDAPRMTIDINFFATDREHAGIVIAALRQVDDVEISEVDPPHIHHDYSRRAIRVVLLAPPGAGKGTQARSLRITLA